ncbi:MAG: hypothetical protein KAI66_10370 [Lentisphaeria bacterium]|nr:hypothetical protein [Lentisphaeria bacterium]
MTSREVVTANIECRCEGRIGLGFGGGRHTDFVGAGVRHTIPTERWEEGEFEYYTDIWGNVWFRVRSLSKGGEIYKAVLEDWRDLDELQLPDLDNPEYYQAARELCASDTDKFRMASLPGWPFATCRYMRKMEIYFVDLIAERERIDILHDRVTTLLEGVIEQFGLAGMDGIFFCEDLGVQDRVLIGPAMWDDIYRPLYERLTAKAHAYGMKVIQHSCGYNWELVDALSGAGIDCFQFDQPAVYDQPALAEKLRKHGVGLYTPCDIQKVLPTGDRALIVRETKRLVDTFRGGFLAKNYGDLFGIGVEPEWDQWAYEAFLEAGAPELL